MFEVKEKLEHVEVDRKFFAWATGFITHTAWGH